MIVELLAASDCMAAKITLTWNPVADCTYQIHYGNASRNYTGKETTDNTEFTLNLGPGVYYFAVTAHWKQCTHTLCGSEYSDEVSVLLSDKPAIATLVFSP